MRFWTSIALVATTACFVAVVVQPAAAAPDGGTISVLQSKAAQIEAQISNENQQVEIQGQKLDDANVEYDHASAALTKLKGELVRDRHAVTKAQTQVRQAAVASYVLGDSTTAQYGAILSKNVATLGTVTAYAGAATGALHTALTSLQRATARVQSSEATQRATLVTAKSDVATATSAQQALQSAMSSRKATLSLVKGNLASALAAQAREEAIAAAKRAAAAAAQRQAAAEAAAQAEAQQAAGIAAAAAQADPGSASITADANAAADAASTATSSTPIAPITVGSGRTNPAGNAALAFAKQFLGVPYVWGGANSSGVDCSGLTMLAWRAAGVLIDHSAYYQYRESTPVAMSALEPGDLLFYYFPNDGADPVTHVAMYVGNNTVIQAPETGQVVSYHALYTIGLVGAGRP